MTRDVTNRSTMGFPFALYLLILTFTFNVHGQDLPDIAQGIQPYVSYHGGDVDQINLANGGLTVRIPLFSFPQRGSLSLSYSIVFNSNSYMNSQSCVNRSCISRANIVPTSMHPDGIDPPGAQLVIDQELLTGGLSQYDPAFFNIVGARYYITTSDGSQHPLARVSSSVFRSIDGSGFLFQPANPSEFPLSLPMTPDTSTGFPVLPGGSGGTVTDRKGIVYTGSSITDPDSNSISLTGDNTAIDSIGRHIPQSSSSVSTSICPNLSAQAPFQPLVSATQWQIPVFGGGFANYTFCYATVNVSTNLPMVGGGKVQLKSSTPLLQSVVLPNGQYWGFIYDSADTTNSHSYAYAQLQKLLLPTGGSITYTYPLLGGGSADCDTQRNSGLQTGITAITYPWAVSQRTKNDGLGNSATWTYSYPAGSGTNNGSVTSPAPANDITVTNFTSPYNGSCELLDAGEQVYKGSVATGIPLKNRTVSRTFNQAVGFPEADSNLINLETTVWQGVNTEKVTHSYDNGFTTQETECMQAPPNTCSVYYSSQVSFGEETAKTYTDFTNTTLKTDTTAYLWQSNSAYLTKNLLDLPSQTQTLNGSGTTIASTTYTYDESAYSPGGTRGHPTTITRWLNTGASPVTHFGWTSMGMKSYFVDALGNHNASGHTVDYGYTNTAAGCYNSVVTSTTNALNQQTLGTYDCNTGLLQIYKDPNLKSTTLNFDALNRIRCVEYPDGGSTAFNINDAVGSLTVDKVVRLNGTDACNSTANNIDTQYAFDGLGRPTHTRPLSDPYGTIYTDTVYDNMGRVASVSNPYRFTSDPTYGVTQFSYDALSRKVKQTDSDGTSIQQWCYDNYSGYGQSNCHPMLGSGAGEWVDHSDESTSDWQNVSDSLGRLKRVFEPNGTSISPSMETDYGYDGLSNLQSVTQWGRRKRIAKCEKSLLHV